MNIPTREECINLLKEYNVPEDTQKHCKAVNKVAVFLAKKLKEKGVDIDVDLVSAGSLLHDIGKSEGEPAKGHAERGYELLKEKYPEVAEIVKVHSFFKVPETKTWEQKVVNYSDKRAVLEIITFKERLEDWQERLNLELDPELVNEELEIEKEIFNIIELEPDKLGEYIE